MQDASKKRPRFRVVLDLLKRLLRKKPAPPDSDPYAYVGAPLRRGPKGRSGAAVAEMENDSFQTYPTRR